MAVYLQENEVGITIRENIFFLRESTNVRLWYIAATARHSLLHVAPAKVGAIFD